MSFKERDEKVPFVNVHNLLNIGSRVCVLATPEYSECPMTSEWTLVIPQQWDKLKADFC